jgi:hypothetical protein
MSEHISRRVATALATALSAKSWTSLGGTTEVAMRRRPDYGLEDLGSLIVSVVPGPVAYTTETRQMETAEVTVGVVVAEHVGSDAEIQKLEDFQQEIVDAIRSGAVAPAGLADGTDWTEIANPVPYDPEQLETRNVFLGQITVTYTIPMDRV